MKAKQRTFVLLLFAAAVLCAALFWVTKSEETAQEDGILLCTVEKDEVEQIRVDYQGESLTLAYEDGSWALLEDPAYHLDSAACNTMLTALTALTAERQFEPENGEDYGLDQPQLTVTVTAAGQSESFSFGTENPVTGDVYLSRAGESSLYTVSYNKVSCFQKTKTELFGAFAPAGVTASEVEQITYTLADGSTVSLVKTQRPQEASSEETEAEYTSVWRLSNDPEAELDEDRVQDILTAVSSYVSGQLTGADPADYGFDRPMVTMTLQTAEKTIRLTYASGVDGAYLMLDGDDSVYKVDLATLNKLLCSEEQLKTASE